MKLHLAYKGCYVMILLLIGFAANAQQPFARLSETERLEDTQIGFDLDKNNDVKLAESVEVKRFVISNCNDIETFKAFMKSLEEPGNTFVFDSTRTRQRITLELSPQTKLECVVQLFDIVAQHTNNFAWDLRSNDIYIFPRGTRFSRPLLIRVGGND